MLAAVQTDVLHIASAHLTEAEVIAHHKMDGSEVLHHLIQKLLPGHIHGVIVEVNQNHIIDAKQSAHQRLSALIAANQGNMLAVSQCFGMHIKADGGGNRIQFFCALYCQLQQFRMTCMHSVKEA